MGKVKMKDFAKYFAMAYNDHFEHTSGMQQQD